MSDVNPNQSMAPTWAVDVPNISEPSIMLGEEVQQPDLSVELNPSKEELVETVGFLRRLGRTAVDAWNGRSGTTLKIGIVAAEVLPVNEGVRFVPALAAQTLTNNSLAGGLTVTAMTALVEGSAAYATADLMETNAGKKVFDWLHKKTDKVLKGRKVTDNPAVEMAVTYGGGSAVIMAAKKAENPDMTRSEILKQGKFAAGWLAPVVGIQWVTGANAIQNPTPTNIALGLGSTVGAYAGAKLWQKRGSKD